MSQNRPETRDLAAKLYSKVMACYEDTSWIAKSGVNTSQNYKFARAEDMYHAVRQAFAKHGLALRVIPQTLDRQWIERQNKDPLQFVVLEVHIQVIDVATGYRETTPWKGECIESGDKAFSKCLTAALKYFLRTQLMIPTGDDPDQTTADAAAPAKKEPKAKAVPKSAAVDDQEKAAGRIVRNLAGTKVQFEEFRKTCHDRGLLWFEVVMQLNQAGGLTGIGQLIDHVQADAGGAVAENVGISRREHLQKALQKHDGLDTILKRATALGLGIDDLIDEAVTIQPEAATVETLFSLLVAAEDRGR